MIESVKKIYRKIFRESFIWPLDYFFVYWRNKRFPNILRPQDYSVYVFRDNLLGGHNKHAYLADKYEVRKYVEDRGLGHTLTKLYGVWDKASDIDFERLPDAFAIKCTNSCGTNIICQDKNKLDIEATRNQLQEWLDTPHPVWFEQHYFKLKPRIICEELIPNNEDGFFPMDYKIHCANGKPVFIQCCFERTADDVGKRAIYSTDWKDLNYVIDDYHHSDVVVPRPKHLEELLLAASILSKGLDYARIDLYDTDKGVLFGEVTLTPMGGWLSYFKQEALDVMGKAIRENQGK